MVSKAALLLPLGIDDLHARLQNVAAGTRDDASLDLEHSRSQSISSASPSPRNALDDLEVSCRQELARDGGRPVCSIEELSQILNAPTGGHDAIMPWLTDFPETQKVSVDLQTVFTRQFARWWDFRKSQWDNRGLVHSEAGFLAYLEASKRKYEGAGDSVSESSFDETIRRLWQGMPASEYQPPPEGQTFAAYSDAIKIRLAPYRLTPLPQLRKDPQKQTAWTDWLEYLSFELRWLERLTAVAESLEPKYHRARMRLLKEASSMQPQKHDGMGRKGGVNMAKELAAAQADREASQKLIDDFIRVTETYTRVRRDAVFQRYRVEWAVKEARLMQTEMVFQRNLANSRKRKQLDEEPPEPQPQPKRTRQGGGSEKASSTPQIQRSTRLTGRKG